MIGFTAEHRKTYRIRIEEGGAKGDPFAYVMTGRLGHLYVHGPGVFGVSTNSSKGPLVGKLRKMPAVKIVADASDGVNAVFPAEHFKAIARMVKAYRRRKLSPEQRAAATARLLAHRLSSENKRAGTRSDAANGPEAVLAA
jgi:hypothetical protein